jgi:group I intron endonuclease
MKYIYLITSPSGKKYIGKCSVDPTEKSKMYQSAAKYFHHIKRPILTAIRKYGWEHMKFEIIERDDNWTTQQLNDREKYWIGCYDTLKSGYNVTSGGDGHDSYSAKLFWTQVSEQWKNERAKNCSKGQKQRYANSKDSNLTKKRKSDSHKGTYRIESPVGQVWETDLGLKEFAEKFKNDTKVTYWTLFNAYRKCYTKQETCQPRKNTNLWKVTRIDKPNRNCRNLLETRPQD